MGRIVNKLLTDRSLVPQPIKGLGHNLCARAENALIKKGNKMTNFIKNNDWVRVYDKLPEFRGLVQLYSEACPIGKQKITKTPAKTQPIQPCPTNIKKALKNKWSKLSPKQKKGLTFDKFCIKEQKCSCK